MPLNFQTKTDKLLLPAEPMLTLATNIFRGGFPSEQVLETIFFPSFLKYFLYNVQEIMGKLMGVLLLVGVEGLVLGVAVG